jgi:hypothetical protein
MILSNLFLFRQYFILLLNICCAFLFYNLISYVLLYDIELYLNFYPSFAAAGMAPNSKSTTAISHMHTHDPMTSKSKAQKATG